MRISDWSSDVCSSDLLRAAILDRARGFRIGEPVVLANRAGNLGREIICPAIVHRIDIDLNIEKAITQRVERIGGEGREAALARQKIADERDVTGAPFIIHNHLHCQSFRLRNMGLTPARSPSTEKHPAGKECVSEGQSRW